MRLGRDIKDKNTINRIFDELSFVCRHVKWIPNSSSHGKERHLGSWHASTEATSIALALGGRITDVSYGFPREAARFVPISLCKVAVSGQPLPRAA